MICEDKMDVFFSLNKVAIRRNMKKKIYAFTFLYQLMLPRQPKQKHYEENETNCVCHTNRVVGKNRT